MSNYYYSLKSQKFVEHKHCLYVFQHFYASFVTEANDPTGKFEWITEEGRIRMLEIANEAMDSSNSTMI